MTETGKEISTGDKIVTEQLELTAAAGRAPNVGTDDSLSTNKALKLVHERPKKSLVIDNPVEELQSREISVAISPTVAPKLTTIDDS